MYKEHPTDSSILSEWSGTEYIINFTKVETMITGVITYIPPDAKYSTDKVLLRTSKFLMIA